MKLTVSRQVEIVIRRADDSSTGLAEPSEEVGQGSALAGRFDTAGGRRSRVQVSARGHNPLPAAWPDKDFL